ncbi:unnamed protein product [Lactuca virosa]|uniref:RecA family profile 2 domain-containing protein n=1 Tax=Lactuca virosa TaxID=75947 RepID=A0AAU9M2W3_9ASTR|nr:unnamed protein product [Lactuca virosa]
MGNLLTNISLGRVSVSFTYTIKAMEPFFTVLFSALLLSELPCGIGFQFLPNPMEGHYEVVISLSEVVASDPEDDKLHDDIKAVEKHTSFHSAISELAGHFDGESMLFLQRFFRTRVKHVVSIGSLKLDLALGIGGLPNGRIVEVYGQKGSGKTTLALNKLFLVGYCDYLDVENALDPLLLETICVNTKSILISKPNSAENLLSIVDTLTQSGAVDVIFIDSVSTLIPQREITGVISDNIIETQSRIMTRALRKIHYYLYRSDTLIIFINQVRSNLRSRQEGLKVNEVTCGGNALLFYSVVRMRTARKGLLKTQEKITGLGICVEVVKNKLAPAMKKAELEIEFGRGISRASKVLKLGCEHGVVLKEGNSYFIDGEVINGKMQVETYLIQNTIICDKLVKTLRRHLFRIAQDSES